MAIRNSHWYNMNEQRDYPLDDTATALSDAGVVLPSNLIADLRIRWSLEYGQYAFVSAVSVTPYIVTVLIEAADTLSNNPRNSKLIAGVSVPKTELVQGRTYAFKKFQDIVGGFIAFGSGVENNYTGTFSTPQQSLLTPRAARASRRPPVTSVRTEYAETALTGLIRLEAAPPLQISKETHVIDGVTYDNVIVFRLIENVRNIATTELVQSVFSEYAGPCGQRVGSKSCADPQPLTAINGITPDCDGVLTLDFRGCAIVGQNSYDCGVTIDCSVGLSGSCAPHYLPTLADGKLPSEVPPAFIIPNPQPPEPPDPPDPPDPPVNSISLSYSDSVNVVMALPYCDTFDDGIAHGFTPVGNSLFGFIADDSPTENYCCDDFPPVQTAFGCNDSYSVSNLLIPGLSIASSYGAVADAAQSRLNISLFNSDVQTFHRTFITEFKVREGLPGSRKNGGIIANYRVNSNGIASYFLCLLNLENNQFGLYHVNGSTTTKLASWNLLKSKVDAWYRMIFEVFPASATTVGFKGFLKPPDSGTNVAVLQAVVGSNLWVTDSAKSGLYADRSKTYFSYWRVEERPT